MIPTSPSDLAASHPSLSGEDLKPIGGVMHPFSNHVIQSRGGGGVVLYRHLFVIKNVFKLSELHFSEVTYKIHTLMAPPGFSDLPTALQSQSRMIIELVKLQRPFAEKF